MFEAMTELLTDLHFRWSNESAYEDITQYGAVVARNLPKGFALKSMTKWPFGFQFSIGNGAVYSMTCTLRAVKWARVS